MRNPALSIDIDRPTSRHVRQNANLLSDLLAEAIAYLEGDEAAAQAAEEAVKKPLDYLEGAIGDGGWLDWNFSVGDVAIAAWVKTLSYGGWTIDSARYPKLAEWYARVSQRAAWQQAAEEEAAVFASLAH